MVARIHPGRKLHILVANSYPGRELYSHIIFADTRLGLSTRAANLINNNRIHLPGTIFVIVAVVIAGANHGVGLYGCESTFKISHTYEFVGRYFPAAQPVRASQPPQPCRWVCEEGGHTSHLQRDVPT